MTRQVLAHIKEPAGGERLHRLMGYVRRRTVGSVRRYRAILESRRRVELDVGIAESAARLRVSLRLKIARAVQAASALATNAAALVTYARDFSRMHPLRSHLLTEQTELHRSRHGEEHPFRGCARSNALVPASTGVPGPCRGR